jgi:hypothetical protein
MISKYMKNVQLSLAIREREIKTTVRYFLTLEQLLSKYKQMLTKMQGCRNKFLHPVGRNAKSTVIMENSTEVPQKTKTPSSNCPTSGYRCKGKKTNIERGTCTSMFMQHYSQELSYGINSSIYQGIKKMWGEREREKERELILRQSTLKNSLEHILKSLIWGLRPQLKSSIHQRVHCPSSENRTGPYCH